MSEAEKRRAWREREALMRDAMRRMVALADEALTLLPDVAVCLNVSNDFDASKTRIDALLERADSEAGG